MAVRGLAAALTGGWFRGGSGEPLVATAARARRARAPPPPPGRAFLLPSSPSLTAPASPVRRRAAGGQGVTFRCPPETPLKAAAEAAVSLPASRPEVAVAGTARGGSHCVPPPRAAPCGPCWQHVAAGRGGESRACAAPAGSASAGGGGEAGGVSQCCWRPGGGTAAAPTPLHQGPGARCGSRQPSGSGRPRSQGEPRKVFLRRGFLLPTSSGWEGSENPYPLRAGVLWRVGG